MSSYLSHNRFSLFPFTFIDHPYPPPRVLSNPSPDTHGGRRRHFGGFLLQQRGYGETVCVCVVEVEDGADEEPPKLTGTGWDNNRDNTVDFENCE